MIQYFDYFIMHFNFVESMAFALMIHHQTSDVMLSANYGASYLSIIFDDFYEKINDITKKLKYNTYILNIHDNEYNKTDLDILKKQNNKIMKYIKLNRKHIRDFKLSNMEYLTKLLKE
jgi:hypothetical protein